MKTKMKKKLTVNSLALGNLRQRKKKYTILIIGIILAMVFSSGTLFFLSCVNSSNEEYQRRAAGNYFGYYYAPNKIFDIEKGKADGYIKEYGYAHIIGYAYTDEDEYEMGTPVAWLDENAKDLYYVTVLEGKYPENKGEIAIEQDAAYRLNIKPVVGEKITVSLKTAAETDYLDKAYEKTYTIVGILEDKRKNSEAIESNYESILPAAFVSENEEIPDGGKEILAVYFNPDDKAINTEFYVDTENGLKYPTNAYSEFFQQKFFDEYAKIYGTGVKNYVWMVKDGYFYSSSIFNSSLVSITLAIVLFIASCVGIINAFSNNLKERRKQIGMLRAVGATRRQIMNIFGRETLLIALICMPVSVLISYFGVKLFAKMMGESFIFIPDFTVLIFSAIVSVICVCLASLIPLITASKISPMQAIRNVELSRQMKRKRIKTEKEYELSKLLAKRSVNFYKGKQVGVSVILVITIFISSLGFAVVKDEIDASKQNSNTGDYVTRIPSGSLLSVNFTNISEKIKPNAINEIVDYPIFSSVTGYKKMNSFVEVEEENNYLKLMSINDDFCFHNFKEFTKQELENLKPGEFIDNYFIEEDNESYSILKNSAGIQNELYSAKVVGYDENLIEAYRNKFKIIDGKIDTEKLNSGEEVILVSLENPTYTVSFDEYDEIRSYGISELDEEDGSDGSIIVHTEKNPYRAGDTIKLVTLFNDAYEIKYETNEGVLSTRKCEKEVKIGAVVKPLHLTDSFDEIVRNELGFITTSEGIDKIAGETINYRFISMNVDGEITNDTDKDITEYLENILAGSGIEIVSNYAIDKDNEESMRSLLIAMLSIIILMFAVCAAIVNNTLTGKIRENRREIGTLRAVGATTADITKTYIRLFISMFAWGMGIGFGGYTVVHICIKIFMKDIISMPYLVWPSLIICGLLCVVCSINLYIKIKQETKNSIVENIREL